ncbi:hypothetical protein C4565_08335 [Candidatus Parcubacteria bacterium]|nr:MAG: hypothetical protein C4565_08335 [Candidatus Parcubacteria bacterium]
MPIPDSTKHTRGDIWHHADGSIGYTNVTACDSNPETTLIKLIIPMKVGFNLFAWRYPFELVEQGWTRISVEQPMHHISKALDVMIDGMCGK